MIPILSLNDQYKSIKREINKAIKDVVDSQHFVLGKELSELEKEIAIYCQTKYGVGVASGTDALILSLMALDIKAGDEVITSPFTFFSSAEAVSLVGAKPVFVDIDRRTYTIDPKLIEKKITPRTKAIIPVHLYGQCADMDPILAIAKKHGLKVIEDCAQAIGAGYKGKRSGSMGDMGALSFYPSKNLGAYGEGGMIVTNDEKLAQKVKMLRVHGSAERYLHAIIGTNSRLDNLQAAVLRVKAKYIEKWQGMRRANAQYYDKKLKGLPLETPYVPEGNTPTYHLYVLKVHADTKKFIDFLTKKGIESRTYYPVPLHLQECYKGLGYKAGDLPESEAASVETAAIPLYPEIKKRDMNYIVASIKEFFKTSL